MKSGLLEKVKDKFNNLPLSDKLFYSFSTFLLIPVCIFSLLFYKDFYRYEYEKVETSTKQSLEQGISFIEFKIRNLGNLLNVLSTDAGMYNIIKRNYTEEATDDVDDMKDIKYLDMIINNVKLQSESVRLIFYFKNPAFYTNIGMNYISMNKIVDCQWYTAMYENNGRIMWFPYGYFKDEEKIYTKLPPHPNDVKVPTISAVKAVKSNINPNEFIGFIRFEFPAEEISSIVQNAKTGKTQKLFIINNKTSLVCSAGISDQEANEYIKSLQLILQEHEEDSWSHRVLGGENAILGIYTVAGTDWKLVSVLPESDLFLSRQTISYKILLFFIAFLASAYIVAYLISFINTRRLIKFVELMKSAGSGNFSVKALPRNNDEIGILAQNFDNMLTKIAILVEDKFKMGQAVKNAELKALQAQINPHFLYNTLDMINWFAALNKTEEIAETVYSLSTFYKLSLSRGEDIIPLRDEMAHVKAYVDIQNKRFDGFIELKISIAEEFLDCMIPKVTLQPLVENAIFHGILEKEEANGEICIEVEIEKENNVILLSISDNGIGMDNEMIRKIEDCEIPCNKGSAYGIRNINERLRILYGDSYGLRFSSSDQGTVVRVRLPLINITNNKVE